MPVLAIENFNGLDTNSDPYSTSGSPEMKNMEINLQGDLEKSNGYTKVAINGGDIVNIVYGTTTTLYVTNALSAGDLVLINNVSDTIISSYLCNKVFSVASATTTTVEITLDTSGIEFDYELEIPMTTGWNLLPSPYYLGTLASDIAAEINAQGGDVDEIQRLQAGSDPQTYDVWTDGGGIDFEMTLGDAMYVYNNNNTNIYLPSKASPYQNGYSFVAGYNGFSLTTGDPITAVELGVAIGATLTRIVRWKNGQFSLYDYTTSSGVNFTIEKD